MIVVSSSTAESLGKLIAQRIGCDHSVVSRKRFPDGELYVRIESELKGETVILVGGTIGDRDFIETLLLLEAAQGRHPEKIIAVLPYFGYARQHMRYLPGEPISSSVVERAILEYASSIFCVEVHDEGAIAPFKNMVHNIRVSGPFAEYISKLKVDYVISPDDGGRDRADAIASIIGCRSLSLEKKRIDDTHVSIDHPGVELRGKRAVLVDDIISSGGTIITASQILLSEGMSRVSVAAVHGLFINQSAERILKSVSDLAVSNTIMTPYSKIDVSETITSNILEELE